MLFAWAGLSAACGGGKDADPAAPTDPDSASACPEVPGERGALGSIEEVVAQLNAMPKPVTLPCFVQSFARPLGVAASRSLFSAQPSAGDRSPRIFLFSDPLIITVAPAGRGSHLMEFGQLRSETHSLKAEIEFPVERELDPSEPFERILFDETFTNCAVCHIEEELDSDISFATAYTSRALRPTATELVSVDFLRSEVEPCDPGEEPERCALLSAIFDWGEVVERVFPEVIPTFQ
jgi:hypothetical protein